MINWLTLFFLLVSFGISPKDDRNQPKLVQCCIGFGFFAEFFWVLNYLDYCVAMQISPVIFWDSSSSYYAPEGYNGTTNAWEYYFEPVSAARYLPGDTVIKQTYFGRPSIFWDYFEYISHMDMCTPEEKEVFKRVTDQEFTFYAPYQKGQFHVYSENLRASVKKEIIDRFIKLRPSIQKKIDAFYELNMKNKRTIGIHLRGKHSYGEIPFVPISIILAEANKYAGEDVQFFVATDQVALLAQAQRELKGNVIFYDCQRFSDTTAPIPNGTKLHPKLGEDVLIEAMLLSRCDFFVHTISHLSTGVLYLNPTLGHVVLY